LKVGETEIDAGGSPVDEVDMDDGAGSKNERRRGKIG